MKYYFFLTLAFTLTTVIVCSCGGNKSSDAGKSSKDSPIAPSAKVTLDNGLDIIVKEVHSAPIVAVFLL